MKIQLTKRASEVMDATKSCANSDGLAEPNPWHLLKSLLAQNGGGAMTVLRRSGLDLKALKTALGQAATEGDGPAGKSDTINNILLQAQREAERFKLKIAGTAHLLLGLLSHANNGAALFLRRQGLDLLKCRQLLMTCMEEPGSGKLGTTVHRPGLLAVAPNYQPRHPAGGPIIHRPEYENNLITLLNRFDGPHAALIGPKGAGKHSIILGMIQQLAHNILPVFEVPARMLRLDLFSLLGWRWQRAQKKINDLLREVRVEGPFILVLEDLDLFASTRHWEDARFFLRLLLTGSRLPILLVCEPGTFEALSGDEDFLSQWLTPVFIAPPAGETALKILSSVRDRLESFHGVQITDDAVAQALIPSLNEKADAFQFALRLLDLAASRHQAGNGIMQNSELCRIEDRLHRLNREKQAAIELQDYNRAAQIRDEESLLRDKKMTLSLSMHSETGDPDIINAAVIEELLENELAAFAAPCRPDA